MSLPIKITCFFFVFSLCYCVPKSDSKSEKLSRYLKENGVDESSLESILILTEEGCPTCNRAFAQLVQKHLNNPKTLCIISAKGSKVDLSPFLNVEDVLLDLDHGFQKTNIAKGTCAIFLKEEGAIDSIVQIQAKGIQETLNYLNANL